MAKTENEPFVFGLLGRNISYSFSKAYFTQKFQDMGLASHSYVNFDLPKIESFADILHQDKHIKGLNVTIPYKEAIIPFLDDLDEKAKKIGAVNTIKLKDGTLIGYNTDSYGFEKSLVPLLKPHHKKALILGTGGASKAVAYVFETLEIPYVFVSRNASTQCITYDALDKNIMETHTIIVNCTPLGTYPNIEDKPEIPYAFISESHLLFDLIYNPEKTAFLNEGVQRGAVICNGLKMLQLQAEKAWDIWNS
ncbi:shikimate dehydrogenase [Arenibacter sp. GZD96]|uniref:shikimate dehydrogenase family protein n=1 Tax=Aurantibrevibacter litoralis TaxID=3106030 RepID=UPI002B003431|nr:shikimate dehydrogenase [Arenibacter sp. GZD-96]MEA1785102.1 shikimate dehydrogenase [Arenibacter sp. GZD-96]